MLRQVGTPVRSRAVPKSGWLTSPGVAALAVTLETSVIFFVGLATGLAYHSVFHGFGGDIAMLARVSGLVALGFALVQLVRGDYTPEKLLEGGRSNTDLFMLWTVVFLALGAIAFLTKTGAMFSRGWLLFYFATGYVFVLIGNAVLKRLVSRLYQARVIRRRKMMIVGLGEDIARMRTEITDGASSVTIIAEASLDTPDDDPHAFDVAVHEAVETARMLNIEDVVISAAISRSDQIEQCIQAFSLLPVAVHLGAGNMISRFKDAQIARLGRAAALSLMRQPLGPWESLSKRTLDIVAASIALVLLLPVLAVVAVAIKLDSKGPVFFRQRRRGYNLEEFSIWKFRTMTTQDDGDTIVQAQRNDGRVTTLGQILRRYSIDELPQLMNVIAGDMSLVGPRPHAVAHDRIFERELRQYPRRLNMKPGITGWAQVNGFRGATNTVNDMEQRLEHDLFYIDNWSLAFDFYILMLTVVSPKASRNAY